MYGIAISGKAKGGHRAHIGLSPSGIASAQVRHSRNLDLGRIATKSPRKASVLYSLLSRIGDPRTSRSSHDARPVDTMCGWLVCVGSQVMPERVCGELVMQFMHEFMHYDRWARS